MDITVTNNPYQNNSVLSDGTFRVAKLNNDTKRPHIANYWVLNMPKLMEESQKIVEAVGSREHSYDVVLGRLAITPEVYDRNVNVDDFRKLKVNELVRDKTLKAYEASPKAEVEKPIVMQEEPVQSDLPASRVSRLEKTGEIPQVNSPSFKALDDYRDILNDSQTQQEGRTSLSRVGRRQNIDDYSSMENRLVDRTDKVTVGKEAQALDRIATLSPLSQNTRGERSDLQDAYDKYAESEKKKKDSLDTVKKLEQQIAEVKGLLAEKQRKEIADLTARTKANEEETLDYTMHSEDLRLQLEALRSQLNAGGIRR